MLGYATALLRETGAVFAHIPVKIGENGDDCVVGTCGGLVAHDSDVTVFYIDSF